MSVGISLLLHQDFDRAAELCDALLFAGFKIAVHIDKKVPNERVEGFFKKFTKSPDLVICKRINCEWGAFSLVKAQISTAKVLLERFPDVTHVVQLSGSCLPTRPLSELDRFLTANPDTDYIESVLAGNSNWIKGGLEAERFSLYFPFSWRRQRWLFDLFVRLQRKIGVKRNMPKGLTAHIGSQWWALSRNTLSAIIYDKDHARHNRYFSKCWIPDESYFQTLARKHSKQIESRSLTFSRFDQQGNPMVFYDDQLQKIKHLDGYFVRKVWHGANALYKNLLSTKLAVETQDLEIRKGFMAQIDGCEGRRNLGRAGLTMQGAVVAKHADHSQTAAPYSVLVGFDRVYTEFPNWLSIQTGHQVHGNIFSKSDVKFADDKLFSAGNISSSPKIRDYASTDFFKNFVWNHQNAPIVFQLESCCDAGVFELMANDPNANIHYLTGAWLLTLMQENITDIELLKKRAEILKQQEKTQIQQLRAKVATVEIYPLVDALSKPALVLHQVAESICPDAAFKPRILPDLTNWEGLEIFAKVLKNNGMNINFEITEIEQPDWQGKNIKPVLIAE